MKPTRKRDRVRNFLSLRHKTPEPTHSSLDSTRLSFATTIEGSGPSSGGHILASSIDIVAAPSTTPTSLPLQPYLSTSAPKAGHADAIIPPVKQQKAFTKGKSFEKDIAILSASFSLQETPELKDLILLIAIIYDADDEDKLTDILEICARFSVQLASAADADCVEARRTIAVFKGVVEKIREAQLAGDTASLTVVEIANEVSYIRPSFLHNAKSGPSERLSKTLDVTIGTAISVLSIVKSASSLIPVPWVQPVVGQVVRMLQAVSQTRSNYSDMKGIAATAGEFAISCAVILSESREGPSSELERSLKKITRKLESIAQECHQFSQLSLFSRYLQQSAHVGDLQAIKARLDKAIELFQVETQANIKLDTEMIKRNINYASLNDLPSHPEYKHNEYLENSRDDVINDVSEWISNSKESILWIHGPAGLGKSTTALQLIHLLESGDRLAGGVFLRYLTNEHPNKMIQIIAKQLGKKHPQVITSIAEAARKLDSAHDPINKHMEAYLIDPTRALKYPYPLIIVIDALDEWTNSEAFLAELAHIPTDSPVKFILTSRFNYSIERILDKCLIHKYPLPLASQEVIEHYFHHHFETNGIDWRGRKPDQSKIRQLAALADGLLIWAATVRSLVLNKMDERYPHIILDEILSSQERVASGNGQQLESLYRDALQSLFLPNIWGKVHDFLGAAMALEGDLPIRDFAHLLDMPEHNIEEIHQCLAALRTQSDIQDKTIYPARQSFHASFLDFIQFFTPKSDGEPFRSITATDGHLLLGKRCLEMVFLEFLPSFRGQTCTYSELRGFEVYAIKFWPLHLANGTKRISLPQSIDSILANVAYTARQRWATLFLSDIRPGFLYDPDTDDDISNVGLLYEVAMAIGKENNSTLKYHLSCLEIAVRLQGNDIKTWTALGKGYRKLYFVGAYIENIEQCIVAWRQVLKLATMEGIDYSWALNDLASGLQSRFEQRGALSDLEESISLNREALNLRPDPHPLRLPSLNNLANGLKSRFQQQGALSDLEEAISLNREALELRSGSHLSRHMSLDDLPSGLHSRFGQQDALSDLDEAIFLNREALKVRPGPHPYRSGLLNNLANGLRSRFRQQGALSDLDEAISLHREALKLCPAPHPDRFISLNNFASVLHSRFEQQGGLSDLDEAIHLHREALKLCPAPHSLRSRSLDNLASGLHSRFEQQGALSDLEEAISLTREALELCPAFHPLRSKPLNSLAICLHSRFQQHGSPSDLDEAISLNREAVELCPGSHPLRSTSLNNLANGLQSRFEQQGVLSDLDEAISLNREALTLCPAPHQDRSASLNSLANGLHSRFEHQGALNDLDEAISLNREALKLCPARHPDRCISLNNLASVLHSRFEQQGGLSDLDEAISLHREALELRPSPHPDRWMSLLNLGNTLRLQFQQRRVAADIEEAISLHREVIALCQPPHPKYPALLRDLLMSLDEQFNMNHTPAVLDEIIVKYRELSNLSTPPSDIQSWALNQLPRALRARHKLNGDERDVEEAAEIDRASQDHTSQTEEAE